MTERDRTDDAELPTGDTVADDVDLPDEPEIAGGPVAEPGGLGRTPAPPD